MTEPIDAGGGKVVVGADGITRVLPLDANDIAQRQADDADNTSKQAIVNARFARIDTFVADSDRSNWLNQLQTATLPQIETFVRNQINADGVTNLATAQTCLKRIETALVVMMKLIALDARR